MLENLGMEKWTCGEFQTKKNRDEHFSLESEQQKYHFLEPKTWYKIQLKNASQSWAFHNFPNLSNPGEIPCFLENPRKKKETLPKITHLWGG